MKHSEIVRSIPLPEYQPNRRLDRQDAAIEWVAWLVAVGMIYTLVLLAWVWR